MSSGFVSGGTDDKPIQRDDEWIKAQQEIEANRRRKEEETQQQGGKSLYEVLQGNKAAKQEAFEESIKLKNQFRNLDEDEIEFLDSVLESTRAKEEAVRKETTEQLDLFRRQQEEADKVVLEEGGATQVTGDGKSGSLTAEETIWAVNAKKRKRAKEKEGLKGVKLRKSSSAAEAPPNVSDTKQESGPGNPVKVTTAQLSIETPTPRTPPPPSIQAVDVVATSSAQTDIKQDPKSLGTAKLGLGGYSSEEDD
ncbi:hypothetical protein P7C71_g2353, partial [Lecanoromycetidae sp. Uapishka_2]